MSLGSPHRIATRVSPVLDFRVPVDGRRRSTIALPIAGLIRFISGSNDALSKSFWRARDPEDILCPSFRRQLCPAANLPFFYGVLNIVRFLSVTPSFKLLVYDSNDVILGPIMFLVHDQFPRRTSFRWFPENRLMLKIQPIPVSILP